MDPALALAREELRYDDVLALLGPAEAALRADAPDEARVELAVLRAEAYRVLGRADARDAAEAALAAAEPLGGALLVDALYVAVGALPMDQRSGILPRAIGIAEAAGDGARSLKCRIRLAGDQLARGDTRVAATTLAEAEPLAGDDADFAVIMGYVTRYLGEPAAARGWYERAARGVRPRDRLARARGAVGLAELDLQAGRPEEALAHLAHATALLEGVQGWWPTLGNAWITRGEAARTAGRWDEARAAYDRALALSQRTGATPVLIHLNHALVDLEAGSVEPALTVFRALRDRRETPMRAVARLAEAQCAALAGDGAAWDDAFGPFVSGLAEEVAELDVALLARRNAARCAERDGPWLARAARAAAVAVEAWPRVGREHEAAADVRTLWSLAAKGAPVPLGPFLLDRVVGRGAFGEVWAATHGSGTPAAVKLLRRPDPAFVGALEHELRAVAALDHPNVARLLHHGRVGRGAARMLGAFPEGTPWVATELATDGTLEPRLGRMPWAEARDVLLALLDGLAHAHARGVLHLDVKPANVVLSGARPQLADFGLATALGAGATVRGATVGYAAPEQLDADAARLGPWTDLYALGAVAVALVSGVPPFEGSDPEAVARAQRRAEPRIAPRIAVPDGFVAWVRRLLVPDAAHRFRRAADAARMLQALGSARGDGDGPAGRASEAPTIVLPRLDELPPIPRGPAAGACPVPAPAVPIGWRRPRVERAAAFVDAGLGLFGLRRPPLVGRERERSLLWAALRAVHEERRARVVRIEAPPGLGATTLVDWLCERAHEVGAAEVVGDPAAVDAARREGRVVLLRGAGPAEEAWAGRPVPLLVLRTVRPGEDPGEADALDLALGPLPPDEHRALLLGRLPLAPAALEELAAATRGHPGVAVDVLRELVAGHRLALGPDGYALRPIPELPLADLAAERFRRRGG